MATKITTKTKTSNVPRQRSKGKTKEEFTMEMFHKIMEKTIPSLEDRIDKNEIKCNQQGTEIIDLKKEITDLKKELKTTQIELKETQKEVISNITFVRQYDYDVKELRREVNSLFLEIRIKSFNEESENEESDESDGGFENEKSKYDESDESDESDDRSEDVDNDDESDDGTENEESVNKESGKSEEDKNDESETEVSEKDNEPTDETEVSVNNDEQKQKSWAQAASESNKNVAYDLDGDNTEDEETIEKTEIVKGIATSSSTSLSFYDSGTIFKDFIKEDTDKNVHCNFLIFGNGTINYKRIRDTENPFIIYYYTLRRDSKGIEIGRIPMEYESEVRLGNKKGNKYRYYFEIMSFTDNLLNLCPEAAFWQDKIDSHY